MCHGAVEGRVDPSFVDGVGNAVREYGRCRSLVVRVGTVEQLMPESILALQSGKTLDVIAQRVE